MAGGFAKTMDSFKYAGKLRPGRLSPTRKVPRSIQLPDYAKDGRPKATGPLLPWQVEVKNAGDIEGMRIAGKVAREVLDVATAMIEPGITTDDIDAVVHEETIKRGAYPSPLNCALCHCCHSAILDRPQSTRGARGPENTGLRGVPAAPGPAALDAPGDPLSTLAACTCHADCGYPKSCCTSINEVICHGIPDSTKLKEGMILNLDVTCYIGGYHGDLSEMILVGEVDDAAKQLVKVTHDCWEAAIAYCKPGAPFKGIGAIIDDYIQPYGYTSCTQFCGHGIGKVFHTTPNILHYRNNEPGKMEVGNVFTIEPMICEGTGRHLEWKDKWTSTTKDGRRSAQFEHTLLITPDGVDVLTPRTANSRPFWWEE